MLSLLLPWLLLQSVAADRIPIRLRQRDGAGLQRRGYGVTAENKYIDMQYMVEIKAGTPSQNIEALFNIHTPVISLVGRPNWTNDPFADDPGFLGEKSSTFKRINESRAADTLTFGNNTDTDAFNYDDSESGDTANWGAGWAKDGEQESFLHKAAVNWTDKRMGLFLSRHRRDPGKEHYEGNLPNWKDSELMIDGINKDKYTGDVHVYKMDRQLAPQFGWHVPVHSVTVNGDKINAAGNATHAEVSTTWNWVLAPEDVVRSIYAGIPGAKLRPPPSNPGNHTWVFPCENVPNISLSINIGGDEYPMAAVDMVRALDEGHPHGEGFTAGATPATGSCIGLFRSNNYNGTGWLLGTGFLKNVYTVFDFETPAVGFAKLSDKAQPDVKPSGAGTTRALSGAVLAMALAVGCLW